MEWLTPTAPTGRRDIGTSSSGKKGFRHNSLTSWLKNDNFAAGRPKNLPFDREFFHFLKTLWVVSTRESSKTQQRYPERRGWRKQQNRGRRVQYQYRKRPLYDMARNRAGHSGGCTPDSAKLAARGRFHGCWAVHRMDRPGILQPL